MNTNLLKSISFEVQEQPVFVGGQPVQGYKALRRSDNQEILRICKESYVPTPNKIFENLAIQFAQFSGYELAGFQESENGNKVLAYLHNWEGCTGDTLKKYDGDEMVVIGNSHDGTTSLFFSTMTTLYRCANQFTHTHAGRNGLKVYHTKHSGAKIEGLPNAFELYKKIETICFKHSIYLREHM